MISMSGTYHLVEDDKIPKSNLIGIIEVLNEDAKFHIVEIEKLNSLLIEWINQPSFHEYLYFRMGKAYDAYRQTQEQLKYYGEKLAKAQD